MSLHSKPFTAMPEETARVARAAFPQGNLYIGYWGATEQKTRVRDYVLRLWGTKIRQLCGELQKTSQKESLLLLTFANQKPLTIRTAAGFAKMLTFAACRGRDCFEKKLGVAVNSKLAPLLKRVFCSNDPQYPCSPWRSGKEKK
jgi:hypothetical protein